LSDERVERRLAAILAADVAGYSRLMGANEEGTLAQLKTIRKALVDPTIATHRGRIVKTTGDGMLVEFASAVDAARCAVEVQRGMVVHSADVAQDLRIEFRIGIHVGDIIIDDNDIFGDGVNIAARLEGIAEPGGVCISDDAQRQIRGKIDIAFEDMGSQTLKNIIEPMRAWRMQVGSASASALPKDVFAGSGQPLALPDKPSIAVLPFQNMSGDPEQEYFADGMVEDVTTGLSRIKWLFVIARNSSFAYKGKAIDIKRVGRELGVRYVLEGSVRKSGNRVRITGQLIEVATNSHLWADRFDGDLEDVFDLQDRVTSSVIGAISPKLEKAEIELARQKPTQSLGAYDLYLRGLSSFYEFTREGHRDALPFFQKAVEIDPQFALAYAAMAGWYITGKAFAWTESSEQEVIEAEKLARRSLKLTNDDPRVLAHAGQALTYVVGKVEEGASVLDRAVNLDPNLAIARLWSGGAKNFQGNFDGAIEQFQYALRLSPLDPRAFLAYGGLASAHFLAGRYDQALDWATAGIRQWPHFIALHRLAMACYAMLGQISEAQEACKRVLGMNPNQRISGITALNLYRRAEDVERIVRAWRIAGMPE
jgi:TolB-like protein/class 3 adenylate cyclase